MGNNDSETTWLDMYIKAMNYLYSALSNKVLEYVKDLDTSRKIILKLDEMYEKPSTSLQIVCRSNLDIIKLQECANCDQFSTSLKKPSTNSKPQEPATF